MSDMATRSFPPARLTIDEYERLAEDGILEADARVELLDGRLIAMPPIGDAHHWTHYAIVGYLSERLRGVAAVSGMASVPTSRHDEPQPDIAIFAAASVGKKKRDWTPHDLYAVIEIADTSLLRDTTDKLRAYARGGISEYLIVDLRRRRLLRYRSPSGDGYDTMESLNPGEHFALQRIAAVTLEVSRFFLPAEDDTERAGANL